MAGHFTAAFARWLLEGHSIPDLHVLNVNVPLGATPETPWRVTRLSHHRYYVPIPPKRDRLDVPGRVGYEVRLPDELEEDSDVRALRVERVVSVTPLSLDQTSRVDPRVLTRRLEQLERQG
jgi:5'-nucleotidase